MNATSPQTAAAMRSGIPTFQAESFSFISPLNICRRVERKSLAPTLISLTTSLMFLHSFCLPWPHNSDRGSEHSCCSPDDGESLQRILVYVALHAEADPVIALNCALTDFERPLSCDLFQFCGA